MDTRCDGFCSADELRVILDETERLYQVWDTVKDARCECYYVPFRARCAKKLRDLIGPDAYYRGVLPPAGRCGAFRLSIEPVNRRPLPGCHPPAAP